MKLCKPMQCKYCDKSNPMVFFNPVPRDSSHDVFACTCLDCAIKIGWCTSQGDVKEGVSFN